MDPIVLLAATLLAALLVLLIRNRPGIRRNSLLRYARRIDLPVSSDVHTRLEPRFASRSLSNGLGGIAGIAVVAAWAATLRPPVLDWSMWLLVVLGALFTGGAIGAGLSAAWQATRRSHPLEPRVARPTAVTLDHYVAPLELQGGRVMALLPALVLLAAWGTVSLFDDVSAQHMPGSAPVLLALLSLLVGVGSEAAARRLLAQPQAAGSDLELAWSDALRARVLRDLYTAPIVVGAYTTIGILIGLGGGLVDVWVILLVGIAIISTASRPHRHFRRQLWPALGVEPVDGEAR